MFCLHLCALNQERGDLQSAERVSIHSHGVLYGERYTERYGTGKGLGGWDAKNVLSAPFCLRPQEGCPIFLTRTMRGFPICVLLEPREYVLSVSV